MIMHDRSEWRGECMTTLGGGCCASGVTLGSYQVHRESGHKLNMKWHG